MMNERACCFLFIIHPSAFCIPFILSILSILLNPFSRNEDELAELCAILHQLVCAAGFGER
jgi:hypothetical protein